jgi:iron(III) transport system permease protein
MLWNADLTQCLINSLYVGIGSALLAVGMGLLLAILTTCLRVPLSGVCAICVLSLVLVPVYVQATAWSAGFGSLGWLRLSQVAAALSPRVALASVVWIHATACAPICFLFCTLGLRRAMDANARQGLLDFGPWFATTKLILPKAWPWVAASALWTVAMTVNDMVVTNLFQVPTLTESIYQQVQFVQLRGASIAMACSVAILIGGLVFVSYIVLWHRIRDELSDDRINQFDIFAWRGPTKWLGTGLSLFIVTVIAILPLANLIVKAGWQAREVDGELVRRWSMSTLVESVLQAAGFLTEFGWSVQLSLYASGLAVLLATIFLVLLGRCKGCDGVALGTMAALLATPGPIINLGISSILNASKADWLAFLADQTLVGPVFALQSRCLPVVFGMLWLAKARFEIRHACVLELDRCLPWPARTWIYARAMTMPVAYAMVVSLFVSFADLSTYLLVLPPGVTTVAMRMFDLLHYGVKNQEAALALVLTIVSAVVASCLLTKRA